MAAMALARDNTTWTNRTLLRWMREAFESRGIEEARVSADLHLERATGTDRIGLYTQADRPASRAELETLRGMVRRTLGGEPVQYVLGEWSFFGTTLAVDRRALIPRPCTEVVCEEALQHIRRSSVDDAVIVDIGTGSGAIAVSVAKPAPHSRVIATDLSPDALELARENVERHGLSDRVDLVVGDGPSPAEDHRWVREHGGVDLLLSNPPYIPDEEWADPSMVDEVVRAHEPELALRGGADGLSVVAGSFKNGPKLVRGGGLIAVEVAASRANAALSLLDGTGAFMETRVAKDLDGHPRVVLGVRSPPH